MQEQLSIVNDVKLILFSRLNNIIKEYNSNNNRKFEFDAVTTRLILAANNDNFNEARNVALKACKKLAMNLKG